MIKAEIVIEDDCVFCNGIEIEMAVHEDYEKFYVVKGKTVQTFEQAIAYCLEQSER